MPDESMFLDRFALGLPSRDSDVLTAKRMLNGVGRLAEPPGGFSPLFDRDLDSAVRELQEDNGLKNDGLITPGGPTERNMRRERGELPAEPPLDLSELDIEAPIGNGLTNRPADIIGVSKALGRLGFFRFDKTAEPPPLITRKFVAGIEKFQRAIGAPVTGDVKPGDRSAVALKAAMAEGTGGTSSHGNTILSNTAGFIQLADAGDIDIQKIIRIPQGKSDDELKAEQFGLNDLQNKLREKRLRPAEINLRSSRELLRELRENPLSLNPPFPLSRLKRRRSLPEDIISGEVEILREEQNRQRVDAHERRITGVEQTVKKFEKLVEELEKLDREIEAQKGDLTREREALRAREGKPRGGR